MPSPGTALPCSPVRRKLGQQRIEKMTVVHWSQKAVILSHSFAPRSGTKASHDLCLSVLPVPLLRIAPYTSNVQEHKPCLTGLALQSPGKSTGPSPEGAAKDSSSSG